ncbi:unnamed protein product, partial [Allacma fusca]
RDYNKIVKNGFMDERTDEGVVCQLMTLNPSAAN